MDLLPSLFGIACCLSVILASDRHRLLLAVVLCQAWAISMLGWEWDMPSIYPVIDLYIACLGYALWFETGERWLRVFVTLAASQLVLHVIYGIEGEDFSAYRTLLDVTFALEILAVSWRGLADVCGSGLRCIRALLSFYRKIFQAQALIHV